MRLPESDLHTHTSFCDGKREAEATLLEAISRGYHTIGISGHSYTDFDTHYCMTDEAGYRAELERLKALYADRISLQIGIEMDALAGERRPWVDYIIGSVHYFKTPSGLFDVDNSPAEMARALSKGYGGNQHAMIDAYFASVVDVATRLRPEIVGHFDLITKFEEIGSPLDTQSDYYYGAALDALAATVRVAPRLEMNSGAISRGYRSEAYPSDKLISAALELGARFILTSDAHAPENIGYAFSESAERLIRLGCTTVDVRRGDAFETFSLLCQTTNG